MATVAAVLFLVLVPLIYLLMVATQQSLIAVRAVKSGQLDVASVEALVETSGYSLNLVALYESNQERIAATIQMITSSMVDLVGSLPGLFIGLTIWSRSSDRLPARQ